MLHTKPYPCQRRTYCLDHKWWPKMKTLTFTFLLLLICFQPLTAQEIGVPVPVDFPETSTTLTLDFSNCDYELILYSIDTHLEDSAWGLCCPLGYSVTAAFGDSNPVLDGGPEASPQVPLSQTGSVLKACFVHRNGNLRAGCRIPAAIARTRRRPRPQQIGQYPAVRLSLLRRCLENHSYSVARSLRRAGNRLRGRGRHPPVEKRFPPGTGGSLQQDNISHGHIRIRTGFGRG